MSMLMRFLFFNKSFPFSKIDKNTFPENENSRRKDNLSNNNERRDIKCLEAEESKGENVSPIYLYIL